jgi:hypothetical protein
MYVNQKLSVVPWVPEHSFCLQGKEYELKESEKENNPTKESSRTYDESSG